MFKIKFLTVAADISCSFRIQNISLLFQQRESVLLRPDTIRSDHRISRLSYELFHLFLPICFLLSRENHVIAVQILGDVQRHCNGVALLQFHGRKIFLKEVRLPLSLLIQNISKVVSVSDQLLQILILLR